MNPVTETTVAKMATRDQTQDDESLRISIPIILNIKNERIKKRSDFLNMGFCPLSFGTKHQKIKTKEQTITIARYTA